MNRTHGLIVLTFLLLAGAGPSAPPKTYYGKVLDPDDKPVAAAKVFLIGGTFDSPTVAATTATDNNGAFTVSAADSNGWVFVFCPGHGMCQGNIDYSTADNPAEIDLPATTELPVGISKDGATPAGVHVTIAALLVKKDEEPQILPLEIQKQIAQVTDARGKCIFHDLPQQQTAVLHVLDDRFAQLTDAQADLDAAVWSDAVEDITLQPAAAVSGKVIDADTAKPAGGVLVRAISSDNDVTTSTLTDADGIYHFKQLAGGEYTIVADHVDGLAAVAIRDLQCDAGQEKIASDLKLIPGGIIRGKVTEEKTGKPVPNAKIGVNGPAYPEDGDNSQVVLTDAQGGYQLHVPPGRQTIRFVSDPPPPGLTGPDQDRINRNVSAGQTVTADFKLPADERPVAVGRVVDSNGRPMAGVDVIAEEKEGDDDGGADAKARTTADGKFAIYVNDHALLRARRGNWTTIEPTLVSADHRDNLTLTIQKNAMASAMVHIHSADGLPLADTNLTLIEKHQNTEQSLDTEGAADDGSYLFNSLQPDETYHVLVEAKGFVRTETELKISPGQKTDELPIALEKADSFVAGLVLDSAGQPVGDVQVNLIGPKTLDESAQTDDGGHFQLHNVAPGDKVKLWTGERPNEDQMQAFNAGANDIVLVYQPTKQKRKK